MPINRKNIYRLERDWEIPQSPSIYYEESGKNVEASKALAKYLNHCKKRGLTYSVVKKWCTAQYTVLGFTVSYYRIELVNTVTQEHIKLYYHAKYWRKA